MGKWTSEPAWTVLLLFSVLLTIALIQALPQVDLPDTAFHEDTAPVVTKFRSTAAPVLSVLPVPVPLDLFGLVSEYLSANLREPVTASPNFVPILYCSLLC